METSNSLNETTNTAGEGQIKICIVDDDKMYRQALKHQLTKNPKYKIFSYKSGEECIIDFDAVNPDIMILDYRLNDGNPRAMNGVEILKRVKKLKPELNVFMLSGQENFEVATNSVRLGAYDYIVKNENAYLRVDHLISRLMNNTKLVKIAKKQLNYSLLIIFVAIVAVLIPITLMRSGSSIALEVTIALFAILGAMLFGLVRRTEKGSPTI